MPPPGPDRRISSEEGAPATLAALLHAANLEPVLTRLLEELQHNVLLPLTGHGNSSSRLQLTSRSSVACSTREQKKKNSILHAVERALQKFQSWSCCVKKLVEKALR